MAFFFNIFQKKQPVAASEPVDSKSLDSHVPEISSEEKANARVRIGPHIVPPKEEGGYPEAVKEQADIIDYNTNPERKRHGRVFTRKDYQDFKADIKAQKNKKKAAAAAAAAAKKQASTEDASKDTKRSSYKEYLKKMIGNESDNSDDGVPLWEQSDEEEEDYEEAIRNARSRGL